MILTQTARGNWLKGVKKKKMVGSAWDLMSVRAIGHINGGTEKTVKNVWEQMLLQFERFSKTIKKKKKKKANRGS